MKGEFICVLCPNGCPIDAEFNADSGASKLISLRGHKCLRGEAWVRQVIENPKRCFSTSIPVKNGDHILASVRITKPVPLSKVMEVMAEIRKLYPEAPLCVGDVLLRCPAGTDTDVIVTRGVKLR